MLVALTILIPYLIYSRSSLVSFPCFRNVDRPELCQVSLYDFQKFLLHDQKVGPLRDPCGIPLNPMGCPSLVSPPLTAAMFAPQESWASDVGMVRDYMCSYLKESSREGADPSFQLDEVGGPMQHPLRGVSPDPSD